MKIFLLLSIALTVALGVPVPEWVPLEQPAEEGGLPLADALPEKGHVVQEDVRPDAGLEKVERPAELSPVVQEKPAEETVTEEKSAQLDPVVQVKPAEQDPVVQDKPEEQDPVVQDKPEEQDPVVQDKPEEQDPVVQDKPEEQDPVVQDKPEEQDPVVQDKPEGQEPGVEQMEEVKEVKVKEEDQSEGPAVEYDLTANEVTEDFPVQEETQAEEDDMEENVFDLNNKQGLYTNYILEEEPAMEEEYVLSDWPVLRSEPPVEEEPVVQEVHPVPGRLRMVDEPIVELEPEEEEAGVDVRLPEAEMAGEPEMELEPLPEEEPVMQEADLSDPRLRLVEEPAVELEPLLGEGLASQDETSMEMEPEEEPVSWARSGLAEGPLMDGMTVKQAMMEEEPDIWVGPDVFGKVSMQGMEEEPETDKESTIMARVMDMDNDFPVEVETEADEDTRPYAEDQYEARPMELPNAVSTRGRSSSGMVIENRTYQFFKGPMQAQDAEFFCQENFPNGHLASITSPYIHQQMMKLMAQNGGYTRTWVGGLKYLTTGRFIWLDGAHWGYADWLPGEPKNTSGVEDCVELLSNGHFNDMPCRDLQAFICSYPL